jgi:geranylgeranylglycerol-phosphate geranylgeranyltransferase
MSHAGLLAITRPVNSVVAGLAAIVAYLIATGTVVPAVFLLFAIVALITAAGNVINDYFDVAIDAINRPERPIPSDLVSRAGARAYATTLFFAGILISLFTPPLCIAIAVVNSLLLVAYAARLKSLPFVGNAAVSYLTASIFLFGGALAGRDGLFHMLPVAATTFLAILARELLKDAEDVKGDRAGDADTLPIRIGIRPTAGLACASALLAAAASIVPSLWWGSWYLAGIAVVDCSIVGATLLAIRCTTPACVKVSRSTDILKAGMFASLVVFTLSAILL